MRWRDRFPLSFLSSTMTPEPCSRLLIAIPPPTLPSLPGDSTSGGTQLCSPLPPAFPSNSSIFLCVSSKYPGTVSALDPQWPHQVLTRVSDFHYPSGPSLSTVQIHSYSCSSLLPCQHHSLPTS